jgi:ligand-binding sensor domain-containing protein
MRIRFSGVYTIFATLYELSMKNLLPLLLLFGCYTSAFAQTNALWKGYFSYNEIVDLGVSATKVYAASENALFSQDVLSDNIKTTNTIDGLSGQTISAIYHSETQHKTLVGYENGLLIVVNERDGSMRSVVDIINKTLPPNLKKINHMMEHQNTIYLSCDFGIVQYHLDTLTFGDTYFIGNNGAQISVKQTAVFNNELFAATFSNGIRKAAIDNPNLNDYNQWTTLDSNGWNGIETFGNNLYAVSNLGFIYQWNGTNFLTYVNLNQPTVDMRASNNYLLFTTADKVLVYDLDMVMVRQIQSSEVSSTNAVQFSCASIKNNKIYIGTVADGLRTTSLTPSAFENITPDGPLRNNIFSITKSPNSLWAVYGDYTVSYNPFPLDYYGISKYTTDAGWLNINYPDIQSAVGAEVASMVRVTVNPTDENQVFASSFHSGLLAIENDVPSVLFNQTNSGLEAPTVANTVRINGTAFDKTGNLWVSNSIIKNALKVKKTNGQWQSYNLESQVNSVGTLNIGRIAIDKNGTKWMCTRSDGIIGFNEGYNNLFKKINFGAELGNLPSKDVRVTAIDNNNQLWIGTLQGLRVLSSVDNFLSSGQMTTYPIIILEDNLAQELLYEQFITDIEVDGANNKWIGTADSGVFQVSPDGQQTLRQFTSTNSPLPSNGINDIAIDAQTGEVFFATSKGMVSFKGTATAANDDLNNVFVYPNPVRPDFEGTVKISGLMDDANVKISDIEGNLVFEAIAQGGTLEWDTTAFGKYRVASGVYMVFISSKDAGQTKVKKVMIIR